jgi:uncharacterized protein with von Willebrand factor type A (vWA) domain
MVLSDGWETGDPAILAEELGAIKGRVCKLIWLNPLLGMSKRRSVIWPGSHSEGMDLQRRA